MAGIADQYRIQVGSQFILADVDASSNVQESDSRVIGIFSGVPDASAAAIQLCDESSFRHGLLSHACHPDSVIAIDPRYVYLRWSSF